MSWNTSLIWIPRPAKTTMLRIHNEGSAECGVYPRPQAERKVAEVLALAVRHGHPLQCERRLKTVR
jgi:ATP-dependent Clp protease adapter protein ClpS